MIHRRFPILIESLEQRIQLSAAAMPSYPTIPVSTAEQVLIKAFIAGTADISSSMPTSAPTRAPALATMSPITISTSLLTSFIQLNITGTSAADSILVAQSGSVVTITANGQTYTQSGDFGDIVIHGLDGNDSITVSPTVTDTTLIYGGNGNDTINALGLGNMTVVTIGNGTNTVTGNGINTSYWVNPNDIVHASAFELGHLNVNRVGDFYQPFSTDPANPQYIPRTLAGQDLPDPTDSGTTTRLTSSSFWGTGPVMSDINQGLLSDCYFEASLASLAFSNPEQLQNMGVDLGDGTYAVRFIENGVSTFVRVDGDLPAGGPFTDGLVNNFPGASGNQWGSIFEKAYAFFRTGQNTYASLNVGFTDSTLTDLGIASVNIAASSDSGIIFTDITMALAANKPVVVGTSTVISGGAPLVAFHAYTIVGAFLDSTGTLNIQLRNPWGIDGFNVDSNPSDGLITITYSDFAANCMVMTYAM